MLPFPSHISSKQTREVASSEPFSFTTISIITSIVKDQQSKALTEEKEITHNSSVEARLYNSEEICKITLLPINPITNSEYSDSNLITEIQKRHVFPK